MATPFRARLPHRPGPKPGLGLPALLLPLLIVAACESTPRPRTFRGGVATQTERVWISPSFFANRLLDWRLSRGRIECVEGSTAKPMRTLHLLTRSASAEPGTIEMRVRTGAIEADPAAGEATWTGFLIGVGGEHVDPRTSSLCHHWPGEDGGLIAALDGSGRLVFRDNSRADGRRGPRRDLTLEAWPELETAGRIDSPGPLPAEVELRLSARSEGAGYVVQLTAHDPGTLEPLRHATLRGVDPRQLDGNVALVSHTSPRGEGPGYWFRDWTVTGSKMDSHPERTFGPVVSTLYTVSRGTLKLTAQMVPLGREDVRSARLQLWRQGQWQTVASGQYQELSATIPFRLDGFGATVDTPFRIAYDLRVGTGRTRPISYDGTIRAAPRDGELTVGALSCVDIASAGDKHWNNDSIWFPHAELTRSLASHDPDLLFFAGDQIYEGGLAGIVREPLERAALDYLYHWYRWCWAFGDLTRERPTVCLPDDHDVYHPNIWGNGGVRQPEDPRYKRPADRGGYMMPPAWVNAVHRTQVSHLPDPSDPRPLANGITTYTTSVELGGVSFAVLADRMWKSPPALVVPEGQVNNGWFQAEGFDPTTQADVPGAELLGPRQEAFLEDWAADWSGGAWMKVLLSQTIFSNVATLPAGAAGDGVVPGLAYAEAGQYIEGDVLGADCDSNGWPQTARNTALRSLRKAFAFHIAGDQHLPSFTQYGVDDWGDAPFAFCVPAVANLWPRRWYPPEPGASRAPGAPAYTGRHRDGFGNRMTVLAVANPMKSGVPPVALNDRNPGYGIVRISRATREIVSECWPRWVDPTKEGAAQFAGWPITVRQQDAYGRAPAGHLPEVRWTGPGEPVVQVIDETLGEVLYTLRVPGKRFVPRVFAPGTYTLRVGDPDRGGMKQVEGLSKVEPGAKVAPLVFP